VGTAHQCCWSTANNTHSNDYVENIKLAVLYGRARAWLLADKSLVPLKAPTLWDAIASATLNPANGLKREDLGRIAVGAKADLCTIRCLWLFNRRWYRPTRATQQSSVCQWFMFVM